MLGLKRSARTSGVAKRRGEGGPVPVIDLAGFAQPAPVDVDDRRVGLDTLVDVLERGAVDFPGHREAVAARLGEANDLLEPGGAGGLEVEARVLAPDDLADPR